ncbi:MAG: sodium:proton antiporter [Fibrobacteria bacterium]
MNVFQTVALLITLTALFSYVNHRFIRLPETIGVMLIALFISLGLIGLGFAGFSGISDSARNLLARVDFNQTLMQGLLSFLLFTGALSIDFSELAQHKLDVSLLASFGVLISTGLIGSAAYGIFRFMGLDVGIGYCFLFGALISPTDPVAVLSILKVSGVPKDLEVRIAAESLFNDGIGVVLFTAIAEIVLGHESFSFARFGELFLVEAIGGGAFGLGMGWVVYLMMKSIDNYLVEVLLSLALVMGGYALVSALGMSGPIAIVVAGLVIGNHGRRYAMSDTTRHHLDQFWELLDGILNAVLFVLVGLEVLLLPFSKALLLAGLAAIPLALAARWLSIVVPAIGMRRMALLPKGSIRIMTWGGLRGGIAVALALSIPNGAERNVILAVTYIVVVGSIALQGLTIQALVLKYFPKSLPNLNLPG